MVLFDRRDLPANDFVSLQHDHSAAEDDSDGGAMDADDETGTYGKKGLAHVVEERMT